MKEAVAVAEAVAEVEASLASSQKGETGRPGQLMATGKKEGTFGQLWF